MPQKLMPWIVIALGGSIVRPNKLNTKFLQQFREFLLPFLKKGYRFAIVVGGGRLAREYQAHAYEITKASREDLDWIGIQATRINAYFLRALFYDKAHPQIIDNPEKPFQAGRYQLIFASGSRPGRSTDYIAGRLATRLGAKEFFLAGKPAYVYDKDYVKFKNARPIPVLTWQEYGKICKGAWRPGIHAPVDPTAANFAREQNLTAIVIGGADLKNLGKAFRGEPFKGSVIR